MTEEEVDDDYDDEYGKQASDSESDDKFKLISTSSTATDNIITSVDFQNFGEKCHHQTKSWAKISQIIVVPDKNSEILTNLTQYLSQLGTTADDLYIEIINFHNHIFYADAILLKNLNYMIVINVLDVIHNLLKLFEFFYLGNKFFHY